LTQVSKHKHFSELDLPLRTKSWISTIDNSFAWKENLPPPVELNSPF